MGATKQIPRIEWESYFDRFTRRHLTGDGDVHEVTTVEVLSPALGDQLEATLVPLLGMAYDPKSDAFEVALENLDHLVFNPSEIWVIEEDDGSISTLEVIRADGTKELIQLSQGDPPASRYEARPEG